MDVAINTLRLTSKLVQNWHPATECRCRIHLAPCLIPRASMPADVGKAAVFLACDDSSYINGTTIVLDGGTMTVW